MANDDRDAVDLTAETGKKEEEKKEEEEGGKGDGKGKGKKKPSQRESDALVQEETALSEEDQELRDRLETCVSTVVNASGEAAVTVPLRLAALRVIVSELRSATASMTSVPKPLKFLRPHFDGLKKLHGDLAADEAAAAADPDRRALRARLADVLSVLAMTMGKPEERESLKFKLAAFIDHEAAADKAKDAAGADEDKDKDKDKDKDMDDNLGSWGHEYVRSLAGEIGQEYNVRVLAGADPDSDAPFADLLRMVDVIVPFHVSHNAEAEAVDLLIEVQRLPKLLQLGDAIDSGNYGRICLYLVKTADFMSADPDDYAEMLETAYELFRGQGQYFDALRVALRMGTQDEAIPALLRQVNEAGDGAMKRQMCLLLGRHRVCYEIEDGDGACAEDGDGDEEEELNELIGNARLSEQFLKVAQDLDVMEPKTPEDIYKSHLAETGGFSRRRDAGGGQVDSARANLASTFVNAFVNAGFGQDK